MLPSLVRKIQLHSACVEAGSCRAGDGNAGAGRLAVGHRFVAMDTSEEEYGRLPDISIASANYFGGEFAPSPRRIPNPSDWDFEISSDW